MSRFSAWRTLTDAQLHRPRTLRLAAYEAHATLIGVVGFSGSWRHNARADAREVVADTLREWLSDRRRESEGPIWCVSGATDLGVPALAYEAAHELDLCCVGVTAAAAMTYQLAKLDHLVPIGKKFGEESRVFVELCDEIWMFGGGPQSEAEIRLATSMNKPVVIARGVGGKADALTEQDLPDALFVDL